MAPSKAPPPPRRIDPGREPAATRAATTPATVVPASAAAEGGRERRAPDHWHRTATLILFSNLSIFDVSIYEISYVLEYAGSCSL